MLLEERMRPNKRMIPNIITALRLVGSICLFFVEPFSPLFFAVYTICGVSDVVDGTVARLLDCESEFGAKLDSVSDMTFYSAMIIRIFPVLLENVPLAIWLVGISIVILRVISYIVAAIKYRRFASIHSYGNKLTGAAVFAIPYLSGLFPIEYVCAAVCVVALAATCEELTIHLISKKYDPEMKSLLLYLIKKR